MGQIGFLVVLYITAMVSETDASRERFIDARDQYETLHKGQAHSVPEMFSYKGGKFQCGMVDGRADCSLLY